MHEFSIDYTNGLTISNKFYDLEYANKKNNHAFGVKTYFQTKKIKKTLSTTVDKIGAFIKLEETSVVDDHVFLSYVDSHLGCWLSPSLEKYLIPYHVEIWYAGELYMSDSLDCKYKLVNFTLHPKDEKELYVWMNVIQNFKKEMLCDISIKNDIVASTTEFDNIVDVKYKTNDDNKQYYLGLHVGRFYHPDSENPDRLYHPDGLHNKNSLDIINDVLYYYTHLV